MSENETTYVHIKDEYSTCMDDSCMVQNKSERRPKGYVEVYELDDSVDLNEKEYIKEKLRKSRYLGKYYTKEPKVKKNNLIVFGGREWLITSIFGVDNSNISSNSSDTVCWVGFGDGGAPAEDPFSPTSPEQGDTDLESSVMINESDAEYGDYRESPTTGYYKKLFSGVQYEQDELNNDKYLVGKVTITLTSADANGYILNEAGLFIASSNTPGFDGDFYLFSRVTFPSISKTESRQLVFIWYVYS